MYIRKRTGELQKFDVSKIEQAIYKAFRETYGEERTEKLYSKIQEMAKSVVVYDGIGIEEIQNKVQHAIRNYPEAVEHYILRRNARAKRRESLKDVVYSSEYLAPSFLVNYGNYPKHMDPVSKFTYLRTYSRDVVELGRRETFKETILRATDHNINMDTREREEKVMQFLRREAEQLFDMQFNLRAFLSGRAMFTGGSNASAVFPLSLFNCSFIEPDTLDSFYDILYLLSVGAGVGYRITWDVAEKLPRFRNDVKLQVVPYNPLPKTMRKDKTQVLKLDGTISIIVGDSRDGWGKAVSEFLKYMSYEIDHDYKNIRMVFNNIRPAGEPLKTFGG